MEVGRDGGQSLDREAPLLSRLSPADLVTPRRLDLAVKWRLFRHMVYDSDPEAIRVYRWHIAKRHQSGFVDGEKMRGDATLDHYQAEAEALFKSMKANGFDTKFPIPVDPQMELLGGAHRVACALVLGCEVEIEHYARDAWAPAWDRAWFVKAGMDAADLARTEADFARMVR